MRYLINNGKPFQKTIYNQRYDSWMENPKNTYRKIVETIILNRDGGLGIENEGKSGEEPEKAKQLGLMETDKAWIYYEDDGRKVSEIFKNGRILQKKTITHIDDSFTVTCYPHVSNVVLGASGTFTEKRKYTILCGKVAEVETDRDVDILMKQFHFLDECNQKGEVIRKNKFRNETTEEIKGQMPRDFGELTSIPKASPEARDISKLEEASRDDAEPLE